MVVVAAVLVTSACTAGQEDVDPYAAEVDQARNEATTEATREILKDDVITAAEYGQVKDASVQCMRDQGLSVEITEEGGLSFEHVGSNWDTTQEETDAWEARITSTMDECEGKFDLAAIESLYWSVTDNPQNTDLLQAVADCLVRGGHRDEGYDKEDYIEEASRYGTSVNTAADGSTTEVPGALSGQPMPAELAACQSEFGG
jgi:hypothetical protein